VPVVLGELHHAVLHNVQGGFLISHMVERALEGALFDATQKSVQLLFRGQS